MVIFCQGWFRGCNHGNSLIESPPPRALPKFSFVCSFQQSKRNYNRNIFEGSRLSSVSSLINQDVEIKNKKETLFSFIWNRHSTFWNSQVIPPPLFPPGLRELACFVLFLKIINTFRQIIYAFDAKLSEELKNGNNIYVAKRFWSYWWKQFLTVLIHNLKTA